MVRYRMVRCGIQIEHPTPRHNRDHGMVHSILGYGIKTSNFSPPVKSQPWPPGYRSPALLCQRWGASRSARMYHTPRSPAVSATPCKADQSAGRQCSRRRASHTRCRVISLFFFFTNIYFPTSGQAVVTGVVPSSPKFLPSILIARRVQHTTARRFFIER